MYCSFLILLQHCSWYLHSMRMLMVQSMCTMSWRTSTRTTAAMSAVGILISSREMYVLYCVLHCTILLCTAPLMFYTILYNINFYTHYYYHTLLLQAMSKSDLETTCESLVTNGSLLLNPCGLIANSFFTGNAILMLVLILSIQTQLLYYYQYFFSFFIYLYYCILYVFPPKYNVFYQS